MEIIAMTHDGPRKVWGHRIVIHPWTTLELCVHYAIEDTRPETVTYNYDQYSITEVKTGRSFLFSSTSRIKYLVRDVRNFIKAMGIKAVKERIAELQIQV